MNYVIYFMIFISKVIENALSTLRLIVVAHGKKFLGAILQLFVSLIWILVTGVVIHDIRSDIFKIISFIFGSFFGSLIGSIIEEKLSHK